MDKDTLDKDYDLRVKKLAADKRSQPTTKAKTAEEIAQEAADNLRNLEQQRIRRMKGLVESDEEEEDEEEERQAQTEPAASKTEDEFGLGKGIRMKATATELGFDDEDDFLM
jgi:nucleolar protein 14